MQTKIEVVEIRLLKCKSGQHLMIKIQDLVIGKATDYSGLMIMQRGWGLRCLLQKQGLDFSEGFSWWFGAFWWAYGKISILYPVSEAHEQKFNSAVGLQRPKASNQTKNHKFNYFIWFWSWFWLLSITTVLDTEPGEIQQVYLHKAKLFEC